ncbi:hypothetical protein F4818DRAFT_48133 [Hypoxylon cercidicola]|nr:hypothetical protein F4818DRAFT_48133 [Hypoxylon cercidicola]
MQRGPSHSGPFGLACMSCFQSKSKCVARPDGDGCQRCHRLNKQCHPSDAIRRRTITKKPNSNARIAELESKLDGLISQLHSRNVLDADVTQQQAPPEPFSQPAGTTSAHPQDVDDAADSESQDGDHTEDDDDVSTIRWGGSPKAMTPSELPDLEVSEAEAETLLGTFRSRMLHHFAFVHLPPELTADQLRRNRPFLFRVVVCVASSSARGKVARSRELKRVICRAILEDESETSTDRMDLLLGLLTYIAWGWDHVLNRCSLSGLMMQAMSLACEMRLDKPIPQGAQMVAHFTPGSNTWSGMTDDTTTQGFLERQRAVLGCFVLSSAVSAYFGQVDALRWTPQMEDGLAAISSNNECATDAAFALQVRLQLLAQKTVQIHQQHVEQGQTTTETAALPVLMSLTTLQGQLQELQGSLSLSLLQRGLVMAHINATELIINETTYAVNSMVPIMVSQFARMTGTWPATGITSGNMPGQERSRSLWQCVRATQSCTSAFLALSPSDLAGVSFLQWAQLAHSLGVMHHLTATIEDQAWDRAAVRAVVDVPVLLDHVAERLELAAGSDNDGDVDNVFAQLARTMRTFRTDITGGAAREHRTAEEVSTAWERSKIYGGGGARGPMNMLGPIGIMAEIFWPDEHSAGTS